jgi:hypothetical protein
MTAHRHSFSIRRDVSIGFVFFDPLQQAAHFDVSRETSLYPETLMSRLLDR